MVALSTEKYKINQSIIYHFISKMEQVFVCLLITSDFFAAMVGPVSSYCIVFYILLLYLLFYGPMSPE